MKSPAAKRSNYVRISYGLLSATTEIASKADCQTILRFLAPDVGLNFLQIGEAQGAAMMINEFRA